MASPSRASARSCSGARASTPRASPRRTRTPTPAPATCRTATGSPSAAQPPTSTSPWPADRASIRRSSRRSAARPSPPCASPDERPGMSEWCGWPLVDDSTSWENAQQILTDAELSDGLPLVPPTRRRLEAMVAGVTGRADSHGMMPPMFGDITPDAVAYQCVIAGCRPVELPVVLAASEAILEPDFNLLGIATTTGTACVALCVHGPIARKLGINAGTNCLGPGNRANASIGRALQLSIRNIGGARPEIGDMATMGQPGKYTFCFAERNDGPFPTLTARRGLGADASAITVMGISGTAEVLPGDGEGATPEAILSPIVTAMRAGIVMSSVHRKNERGEQVFLLPLEMVEKIVRHDGWDIGRVQRYMFDEGQLGGQVVARSADAIHP